ncbi:Di-copper centre-containing protein [Microthyrium microscopicum]|uniref:tyrosinase n=1 Tax=Microthyrium microscopicum TaxID=703497 RepID=A0A6A6TZ24_9PEZI|nr:Di-copper centre-containing protein [Microthyrium microscopicum]
MSGVLSLSLLLASSLGIFQTPAASRLPHIVETFQKRAGATPVAIVGVQNGEVQTRMEFSDLLNQQPAQFNIMMLGLARMMKLNQTDQLSYFRIAGIHGVPLDNWNGVVGANDINRPGWCTHTSNLFLPWHRPYLALYEQTLSQNAMAAALEWPPGAERDAFVTAADQLRLPYWDWAKSPASGQDVTPAIMVSPQVQVLTPNGTQTIDNPLYSYKFGYADQDLRFQPYVYWNETKRWPTTMDSTAETQIGTLVQQMNLNQAQVKQRLYNLFTGNSNFTEVSNEAWVANAGPGSYDSFESIHDQIHGTIGGGNYGDMTVIPLSAFDPAFWFHHAMIDRSFAMWQVLYPDSYVEPMPQALSNQWYVKGEVLDATTGLQPFFSDPTQRIFWTSDTVRNTSTFGYNYPETQNPDPTAVRAAINKLYGPTKRTKTRGRPTKSKRANAYGADPAPAQTTQTPTERLYQISYRAPKNSLGSSFYIDMFMGNPASEDPHSWRNDPNLLGSQAVVSMSLPGAAPVTVTGVLPLNKHLQDMVTAGQLADLSEASVVPLLQDNISWRIRMGDYSDIPAANVPNLLVSLASIEVEPATSPDAFPTHVGDWTVYTSVTADKVGGLKVEQQI